MKTLVFVSITLTFITVGITAGVASAASSDKLTDTQAASFKKCLSEYNDSELCTELAILTDPGPATPSDNNRESSPEPKPETANN